MIAKSIRVVALGVLLAAVVAGPAQAGGCQWLQVTATKSKTPMKLDWNSLKCTRGSVQNQFRGGDIAVFAQKEVALRTGHGPNCTLTFREIGGKKRYATIRVQQNFCTLEAGKITVQMHLGAAVKYAKKEGSFSKKRPGRIRIIDFK